MDKMFSYLINNYEIILFTRKNGNPSNHSINILQSYGIEFYVQETNEKDEWYDDLVNASGWHMFPQLFVKKEFIGGGFVLREFIESGELNRILGRPLTEKVNFTNNLKAIWRISTDGYIVISASANGEVNVYDSKLFFLKRIYSGSRWVNSVKISETKKTIAACFTDATIKLWKENSNTYLELKGHTRWVNDIEFLEKDKKLASVSADGCLIVWDLENETSLINRKAHETPIWSVSTCANNRYILTGAFDKYVRIWHAETLELVDEFVAHDNCVTIVKEVKNTEKFLTASYDSKVKLWGVNGILLKTYKGNNSRIWSVAASGDFSMIASCSADNVVLIWDCESTQVLYKFSFNDMPLWCIFSNDNLSLYVSFSSGTIRQIDVIK